MTETLYLDLLFLVNLAADLWLLVLTGLIRKEAMRERKGKLLLGAAAGAGTGCVFLFLPHLPLPVWVALELIVPSLLMIRIAFGAGTPGELLRRMLVLWMAALFSGGGFSLLESAGKERILSQPGQNTLAAIWNLTPWTFWQSGLALGAFGAALLGGIIVLGREMAFRGSLYEVTIYYRDRKKEVRALLDTGNQLYEPYGHHPVHILERSACQELLKAVSEVIYVPFCSVGKEHGILPAFRMERMEVRQRGKTVRVLECPWVAISETPLSPRHKYEMLLHGEL